MLELPQVTLVAVTGVAIPATVRALQKSMEGIRFGEVLLLSSDPPPAPLDPRITWRKIAPLTSRGAYSDYILRELPDHITTDFALCIQWDGYVLDPAGWCGVFLDYDYIGAVWPQFDDGNRVGNGGFSLRSRRLLQAVASLPIPPGAPEDVSICRDFRQRLESEHGVRFAPEDVASRFAFERTVRLGGEFGFHGVFNLVNLLATTEMAALIGGLEPGLLGKRERRDLIRAALRGLSPRILWRVWRN